ncbi:AP-3 complex subunit beta-2-like isoform X1 [Amphibalanus amphitrite]|uniref:AP-3 complex subunit beta-2-like isoform X1 n=2 Tax=Amphibalanus amphitrite TaxID=1232801 RepID=UPI001C911C3A|nr:AP-3 complex subunit beta-2-like isoform X1 [Amphibalanus amphitrite]XP_043235484.1 AP-3 complex subunit beta-2-like isoform X1 [Amphibalanus amphitrite]
MWDPKMLPRIAPMATSVGAAGFGADVRSGMAAGGGGGGGDIEYGNEATPAGFFSADFKRHDDLKQMLDSSKDNLKLEAMKRIIGMVAKGRDASDLFPAVVKNVVSKNIEVKKLVYTYLVRYAEEKQDLALLSISTFQRALKDPNQLIRANALRVLSSIRVPVIVPIMMLAINDSVVDMSPYVRKTAAHAIPKLYSLDPDQKEELVTVIEKLLADRTTLVVGSAVMAFEEVCPERIDLVHKNFRKLCNVLVDIEEWGQVIIINMLTHYARTQFIDPNLQDGPGDQPERPFYDDSESESESEGSDAEGQKRKPYVMDQDHALLLRSTKPLLQSRNAAVVMGVAQLYHHLAPRSEVSLVTKAMIRLLRSHREVQSVVLTCIASMTTQRKVRGMFDPYLKSFFVRSCDSSHIKILKLEILTNLATESSISIVLREFQTYIASHDKTFVAATIQAIGRCASNIADVTDTCLQGLVALLSNRDESVVAESVVVIKKLLQTQPGEHKEIIRHMARLVDHIKIPMARASILWLIGEYCDRIPRIAPDVLRKMAKTFINEEDIVKLQIVNLASKLCLTNPEQTELLAQYVYSLARYDPSYDLRDRVRLMRHLVFPADGPNSRLGKYARRIFMATKPAPRLESSFKDRDQFQLGSLSHYINARATGYRELASFPAEAPDPTVRNSVVPLPERPPEPALQPTRQRGFYSDSSSEDESEDSDSDSSSSGSGESSGESSSGESSSSEDAAPARNKARARAPPPTRGVSALRPPQASSSDSDEEDSDEEGSTSGSGSGSDSGSESDGSASSAAAPAAPPPAAPAPAGGGGGNSVDLLLELDSVPAPLGTELLTPSLGGLLSPVAASGAAPATAKADTIELVSAQFVPSEYRELVNPITGSGLQVRYRYTRAPHLYSAAMTSVELSFTNTTQQEMTDIHVGQKTLTAGLTLHEFAPVSLLAPGGTVGSTLGVDFRDSTHAARFDIVTGGSRTVPVSLAAPMGEILRPVTMSDDLFQRRRAQLRGMNEAGGSVTPACCPTPSDVRKLVLAAVNVAALSSDTGDNERQLRFAGQTMSSGTLVLITVGLPAADAGDGAAVTVTVNCEKMVVGNMLLKELKTQLLR